MLDVRDLEWAAGFLEGEGSFLSHKKQGTIQVCAVQVHRPPLERLQALFGGQIYDEKNSGIGRWNLSGAPAAGLCMTMYPLMSPRRRGQIKAALDRWKSHKPAPKYWAQRGLLKSNG